MSGKAADWLGKAIASYEWMAAVTLVVVAFVFLPKFLKSGIYTIPEFLEYRYNTFARTIMAISTLIILVGVPTASVTHYRPAEGTVEHLPLADEVEDFRLVSLDTGTDRPGLKKSTYNIRRAECEQLVNLCQQQFDIHCLADVKDVALYDQICSVFGKEHPHLVKRLRYIFEAQQRFDVLVAAWRAGDIRTVGNIFRQDGYGLRDDYEISGPELESMCDLAREVDGVLGERMLGGRDKGASGAIVLASAVADLQAAIDRGYPTRQPRYKDKYSIHVCNLVDGITSFDGLTSAC